MEEVPPPLPIAQWEPLLRGPLVLAAIGRVLMVLLYLFLALASTSNLADLVRNFSRHAPLYVTDKIALAGGTSSLLLLSVLLVWLFFSRRRMFRPLVIYFAFLQGLLLLGASIHMDYLFPYHYPPMQNGKYIDWIGNSIAGGMACWPFYYFFSRRVRRVFTR